MSAYLTLRSLASRGDDARNFYAVPTLRVTQRLGVRFVSMRDVSG